MWFLMNIIIANGSCSDFGKRSTYPTPSEKPTFIPFKVRSLAGCWCRCSSQTDLCGC